LQEVGGGEGCAFAAGDCCGDEKFREKLRVKIREKIKEKDKKKDNAEAQSTQSQRREEKDRKAREESGGRWLRENRNII
jgi:hypothetical protein